MNSIPRRTIGELAVRYQLEPSLHDLYVEGDFDRRIIQWFVTGIGRQDIKVYSIETVEIPEDLLALSSGSSGNKGRVVALMKELVSRSTLGRSFLGVVDKDFDDYLDISYECDCLLTTDYSCMESYFYRDDIVERLLQLYFGVSVKTARDFMEDFDGIGVELFLIRLASRSTQSDLVYMDPKRCLISNEGVLVFDSGEYVRRLLNSGGWPVTLEVFNGEIERLRGLVADDVRYNINGHDLIRVFIFWLRRVCSYRRKLDEVDVQSAWALSADIAGIENENLFVAIAEFFERV